MRKRLIIFDLDGTLLDTLSDLRTSVNYALERHNLPPRSADEIRGFVGNGIFRLVSLSVPDGTAENVVLSVFESFKAHYSEHSTDLTVPYDGIPELLRDLKAHGCRLGVVSNKADFAVRHIIDHYFHGIFDCVAGERENVRRKPAPDTVLEVMSSLNCSAEETVYIGDSDVDILTARNAGCDCISVVWGFRSREFLRDSGAELIAGDANELSALLEI